MVFLLVRIIYIHYNERTIKGVNNGKRDHYYLEQEDE